jgi:hypothetical protein
MLNGAETTFTVFKNGAKRCLTDACGLLACALSKKRKMGKGTRENQVWHLEKEAKGCWQEEKEERVLGLLSQF